jgi:hypothetical protein
MKDTRIIDPSEPDSLTDLARHIAQTGKFLMAFEKTLNVQVDGAVTGFEHMNQYFDHPVKILRKATFEEWLEWVPVRFHDACYAVRETHQVYEVTTD